VHVSDTVAEPVVYLIGLGCIPVRLPAQAAESLRTLRPSRVKHQASSHTFVCHFLPVSFVSVLFVLMFCQEHSHIYLCMLLSVSVPDVQRHLISTCYQMVRDRLIAYLSVCHDMTVAIFYAMSCCYLPSQRGSRHAIGVAQGRGLIASIR
jgi:hypothetical protein